MNLLFEWKNKKIKVRTLKPIPQIEENKIEYTKKDLVTEIPIWMARILKENEMIEILDEKNIDLAKLDKFLWREKNNSNLQPLEDDLYIRIKEYLENLSKKIKKYPTTQLIENKQKTKDFIDDLLTFRLYKILRIVEAKNRRLLIKSLTNEEKILYDSILSNFEKWKSEILPKND
ncbi:MAG: DNA replication complex GINS family protein [Candidatus Helarchaeota archaeon]|nr:DNA replication complex GINS family protein [Candidatus Helarchaeota archaeon]